MDIFRFENPIAPMLMQRGMIINGLTSKMWIERYALAGEFTLKAPASLGLRSLLPIGSFVSHVDTTEIMIVENHEINDKVGQESEIVVTGRGLETEFEQRIVGSNKAFPTSGATNEYALAVGYIHDQIVSLINNHILAADLVDSNNALPYVSVLTNVAAGGEDVARSLKRGDLYSAVQSLLTVGGLGIKVIRPGPWSPLAGGSPNTAILIHKGVDRSGEIIFSADTGEISSADYLWSNKKLKNAAMVVGRWVETAVVPGDIQYGRRWMLIDASDIDQNYAAAPIGVDLTNVVESMQQRGADILATQNNVALTKAEVAHNTNKAAYRKDFDVGDLITVNGSYNESSTMQISEYVEIEDETGGSGYPTLTVL